MMHWWKKPLTVETKEPGHRIQLVSTESATDYLLCHWPKDTSDEAFDTAKLILVDAFDGKLSPDDARDAFIVALRQAGIAIFDE